MVHLHILDLPPPSVQPDFSTEETAAMQRAVITLFDKWGVTDTEAAILLGDISTRTFARWKEGQYGRVGRDLAARLSNLLGIHKALRLLFSDASRAYAWVRKANIDFAERSALEVMLNGNLTDLMRVRHYLDAQRAAW
ncbi:MbcA/ParS/Xre antitoxin family protein [Devosia rhodophyticola]|uniref:MbcA/ParS/Xre antitoxin family protein n=1 Tax=Devosia rhodophyticola TaxID=3026423 RepID=A0ABY7YVZ1_9HYPH|nr:MbcA/ParS/Xre antitoxin family protein [Devosia rhodophyticola]WDR05528.1 MbcA/ParS/Xre antitoxin family protein [Devosia rhodophyticola]